MNYSLKPVKARSWFKRLLVFLAVCLVTPFPARAQYYQVVPIAKDFYAAAFNNNDQVAGTMYSSNGVVVAVWDRGTITTLPSSLTNLFVLSSRVTTNGVFLANIFDAGYDKFPSAVFNAQNGLVSIIPFAPQPFNPAAVNDSGVIAGTGFQDTNATSGHACVYQDGQLTFLPGLPNFSPSGKALAINNHNDVVGSSVAAIVTLKSVVYEEHAVIWSGGSIFDLGMLPDYSGHFTTNYLTRYTRAVGINDNSEVIGVCVYQGNGPAYASGFVYRHGAMEILTNRIPKSINSHGVVVGTDFVYDHGRLRTIASLVDPQEGLNFLYAVQINDAGEILVRSYSQSYILVPPVGINLTMSNAAVTLDWPASANGYVLEFASDLQSNLWSPVTNAVTANGDRVAVTLPGTEARRFFRLRKSFQ